MRTTVCPTSGFYLLTTCYPGPRLFGSQWDDHELTLSPETPNCSLLPDLSTLRFPCMENSWGPQTGSSDCGNWHLGAPLCPWGWSRSCLSRPGGPNARPAHGGHGNFYISGFFFLPCRDGLALSSLAIQEPSWVLTEGTCTIHSFICIRSFIHSFI